MSGKRSRRKLKVISLQIIKPVSCSWEEAGLFDLGLACAKIKNLGMTTSALIGFLPPWFCSWPPVFWGNSDAVYTKKTGRVGSMARLYPSN